MMIEYDRYKGDWEDIANKPKTPGQVDYEANVRLFPTYSGGVPRKAWHQLGDVERWSWNKGPWRASEAKGA